MTKARTLGNFVSTGNPLSDGSIAASEVTGLSTVATTGAYADLSGKPTLPAGTIVGTSDSQTLTNKTLTTPTLTTPNITTGLTVAGASGTSGQVLTSGGSGSAPTWTTISGGVGTGGTTASGNVTLTSASPAQQSVTPTTYGQAVTLPDATTCTKGVTTFGVYNQGPYPLLIKDSAGTLLGFARVASQVSCGLADNSTSAGVWNLSGAVPCEIDAQSPSSASFGSDANNIFAIQITSTKDLIILPASDTYGVIYDSSTQTWGTPVLIRSDVPVGVATAATVISASSVLFASCGTSSTAWQAVILSISGTTLTVNTAATVTLGGNIASQPMTLIPVGSSYVCAYNRSTVACIRALTVSGTTVTIGTEQGLTGTNASYKPVIFAYSTSSVMCFSSTAGNGTYAEAFTVGGTTLGNISTGNLMVGAGGGFQADVFSSGRWSVIFNDGATLKGFVVSSDVSSISSNDLASTSGQFNPANISTLVVGNSVIVATCGTSANVNAINVLTDSSGTANVGTPIVNQNSVASVTAFRLMGRSASALYIGVISSTTAFDAFKITISSGSPVLTFLNRFTYNVLSNVYSAPLFAPQLSNSSNIVPGTAYLYPVPLLVGSKFGNGVFATTSSYATQTLTFLNESLYLAPIPVSAMTNTSTGNRTARTAADTAYVFTGDMKLGPRVQRLRIA
jgi:hypothetical protein